jgi:hypothetical protein
MRRAAVARLALAFVLLLAFGCASTPAEDEIDPDQVSWAGPVDFTDLRTRYGDREDFWQVCESGRPLRELYDAANDEDWETLLEVSAPWLVGCPVDIDVHFLRMVACRETGRSIDSHHHEIWFHGLIDSVLRSGGGVLEDPYIVISVAEEYAVLRALRLDPEEQRLVEGGVDAITARDPDGASITLYFRADAHWRRLEKAFPPER